MLGLSASPENEAERVGGEEERSEKEGPEIDRVPEKMNEAEFGSSSDEAETTPGSPEDGA
jgi:hypothetical protein